MQGGSLELRNNVESIFNVKGVSINESNTIAALITAASKMARCSEIATEDMTVNELLDLYQKTNDEEVLSLIGMGPQFVKANIGYAIDFNDFFTSMMVYNSDKENYDKLYTNIAKIAMSKESNMTK